MLSVLVVLYDNLEFSGGLRDLCTILVVLYDNLEFSGGLTRFVYHIGCVI